MPSESNSCWLLVYKYGLIVLFVFDTLGFFLLSYLIIKQSKGMRRYKWYLLVNFSLSYAFSAGNVLFEPIPLLDNVLAIYFDGLLKNFGFLGVLLGIGIYCSIAAALPFTMLYRFLQQYHNFLQRLFTETYLPLILLGILVLGVNGILYVTLIVIGNYNSGNYTKILIDESPNLLPYEDKPSFMAIPMSGIVELFGICASLVGIGIVIFFSGVFLFMGYNIRQKMKASSHVKMTKLQISLFKALFAQGAIGAICLILPFSVTLFLLIAKSSYSFICGYFFFIAFSLHAILEYLSQLYFITPYRKFLVAMFKGKQNQAPIALGMNQMKLNHHAAQQTTMNPRVSITRFP